ncbi:hypothetical protein [Cognatishimia sp. MH4019]|uniref:hypothetical protein n=1 Tax=Cognatishimia sp. MH4019 TaxID=2854030 RepID=UPI001CD7B555|nr:hypothetical protein [Cognatishimia sp. MH4019]
MTQNFPPLEKPRMMDRMVLPGHTVLGLQRLSEELSLVHVEDRDVIFLKVAYPGNVQFNRITPETAQALCVGLGTWLDDRAADAMQTASA